MIIKKNLSFKVLCKSGLGSVIPAFSSSMAAMVFYQEFGLEYFSLPYEVIGTLGTALAIILSFRNKASYDRWWEARKIWGGIVNYSRSFSRQVLTLIYTQEGLSSESVQGLHQRLIYRHIAWINALRIQLRKGNKEEMLREALVPYLEESEIKYLEKRKNIATQLVQLQAKDLRQARLDGLLNDWTAMQLDDSLNEFYNLQGKSERIKNTPLPRQYDYFPKIFLWLFAMLLPFGLIAPLAAKDIAWAVVPLSVSIDYVFFALRKIGEVNEDPFENRKTDTPLSALCRTIEIDLREMLKEAELPAKLEPVNGFLM